MRVRTVTLLLLFLWGLSFAVGAYQIYSVWIEHRRPYGSGAIPPLDLPEIPVEPPVANRPHMRLGT